MEASCCIVNYSAQLHHESTFRFQFPKRPGFEVFTDRWLWDAVGPNYREPKQSYRQKEKSTKTNLWSCLGVFFLTHSQVQSVLKPSSNCFSVCRNGSDQHLQCI